MGLRRVLWVGFLLLTACSDGTGPTEVRLEELASYETRWAERRPGAYVYTLFRTCECLPSATGPVTVVVDGTSVVDRTYVDSGDAVPDRLAGLFPSVEGLFALLRESIEAGYQVDITFLEDPGIPVEMWIEPDPDVGDDEFGYTVTSLPRAWAPDPM